MMRTFLQVAAGAADIPVTRLLGQSPAGLSATGDSDTRNYYDMIAARQEIDLRPQLEKLDRFLMPSAGVAPGALTFAFRPLWQLSAAEAASVALQKAQATQLYAGLKLWPDATLARLAEAQLAEDETYPGAPGVFGNASKVGLEAPGTRDAFPVGSAYAYKPSQPRDPNGRWTAGSGETGRPAGVGEPRAPDGTSLELAASANDPQGLKWPAMRPRLLGSTGSNVGCYTTRSRVRA